jgi:hypothetical protein
MVFANCQRTVAIKARCIIYFKRTRGLTDVIVAIVLRQCDSAGVIEPARHGTTKLDDRILPPAHSELGVGDSLIDAVDSYRRPMNWR